MLVRRFHVVAIPLLALAATALRVGPAEAASLQAVTTSAWSKGDVPTYISMYIYVPDKVATNPPILVVAHYCGGSASGVFGEAQGGGIVSAADTNGFIMIYPQTTNPATSANCWEVGSTKSLTHNGGGDTQAIAEMVSYTITKYSANADRVYATGTSSGAMMTEALLAVYPDVFKAGAEFSGVPAGCWSAGWSAASNWGGTCAGGNYTQTAQQWGDKVRAMYPGYSGYRPRIQLWHGASDTTISPTNQTEAIKEWTNVLGLSTSPTSTTTVTISSHQYTRQSWQNSCGFTVLDAWLEANGPHGTDANFNATYVIPFLGLDKAGATDPEIAQCGAGGGGGTGGASSTGGTSSAGGAKSTGGASSTGGTSSAGGSKTTGGASSTGGTSSVSVGGTKATGGNPSAGGTKAAGGAPSTGGLMSTGGAALATGGAQSATGGAMNAAGGMNTGGAALATGGTPGAGGMNGTGGNANAGGAAAGAVATGGITNNAGTTGSEAAGASNTGGAGNSDNAGSCGCRVAGLPSRSSTLAGASLLGLLLLRSRRRRQTR